MEGYQDKAEEAYDDTEKATTAIEDDILHKMTELHGETEEIHAKTEELKEKAATMLDELIALRAKIEGYEPNAQICQETACD